MRSFFTALLIVLLSDIAYCQSKQLVVSGVVKDAESGVTLIGATVFTSDKSVGTVTNEDGRFTLSMKAGKYVIVCSNVGYADVRQEIELNGSNMTLDFSMSEDKELLDAAKVFSTSKKELLKLPQMGMKSVGIETIKKVPAFLGETDIIRVIQMMPGVQSPSEGSTGFSVRGGGCDQNLVLMDGAPVYNSGHFLGFFSMFNGDMVKNVKLYKGDFPAKYGEKASSVLDVTTVDGDMRQFHGGLSIGLLTGKINLEGPIVKDKLSFAIGARRSYLDVFFPLFKGRIPEKTKLSFYDINAKVNWAINEKNRLTLSAFSGEDQFGVSLADMGLSLMTFSYRNNTQSLRWNHIFGPKLSYTITAYNSLYDAGIVADMDQSPFDWKSNIREPGVRNNFTWHLNSKNTIEAGANVAFYVLSPSEVRPTSDTSVVKTVISPKANGINPSVYLSNEQKLGSLTLRYGLRYSYYYVMGPTDQLYFDPVTHEKTRTEHFDSWQYIDHYAGLDPRFSLSWSLGDNASIKAAYGRTHQYIQQTSVSTSPGVMDAWYAVSPNVKPLISDQYSIGYNQDFLDHSIQFSAELFYKYNQNTADLKDNPGAVIDNPERDGLLRFGTSYSYGAELMLEYDFSKISGWLGYTWSKSIYDIPEINGGKPYRSPLNHEHAFNAVVSYNISKCVDLSGTWIFYSGAPTTNPVARYYYLGTFVPVYSERNADNMPDYHRLDLSLTVKTKRRAEGKPWAGEWNFSVYNVYNRHNAWSISNGYDYSKGEMSSTLIYLFGIVPSVSYNLSF